jgi:hypothetical protein
LSTNSPDPYELVEIPYQLSSTHIDSANYWYRDFVVVEYGSSRYKISVPNITLRCFLDCLDELIKNRFGFNLAIDFNPSIPHSHPNFRGLKNWVISEDWSVALKYYALNYPEQFSGIQDFLNLLTEENIYKPE